MSAETLPGGLDVVAPAPFRAAFNGRQVDLLPLTVGQLPAFARAVRPLGAIDLDKLDAAALLDLLAEHGDSILQAIHIASGVPLAELKASRDPAEVLALATAAIKVNADFFGRRLGPSMGAIMSMIRSGPGLPPSTP